MSTPVTTSLYTTLTNVGISQLVMKYLQLEGVNTIFGIPGATFVDLLNLLMLNRATMRYVVCKQETGAGYMADGYHRVSGNLGVVLVTSGPGATNALTGAMNAQAGRTAMLVITGEQKESQFGLDDEQEGVDLDLDVVQVYKSAVGYSTIINAASDFPVLFQQALRNARAIPEAVAHVSIPHDVMATVLPSVTFPTSTSLYRRAFDSASPADVKAVADRLLAAKRPLILLGNGTRDALDPSGLAKFQPFVDRFGIPVGTTSDGKALFPESHELALRSCGYPPCQWPGLYFAPPTGSPSAAPYDCLLGPRVEHGRLRHELVQHGDGAGGSVHSGGRRPEDHRAVDADHDGRDRRGARVPRRADVLRRDRDAGCRIDGRPPRVPRVDEEDALRVRQPGGARVGRVADSTGAGDGHRQ
jgi:Thiamine pyrophosphate-requiring enzymes [acetolactate synthase, pyruvate dehydrogenase (cytochrome), glyoxylate carboligase, phosphonopyruvate decarboxylase]